MNYDGRHTHNSAQLGRGGGLGIILREKATGNNITIFAPHSVVLFEKNSGYLGAAITLAGLSAINVQQNSTFTFRQNYASSRGAAI